MHLAVTIVVLLLNLLFLYSSLSTTLPSLWSRPGIETFVAFFIAATPFALTALYTAGKRTKLIWMLATAMNIVCILAMLVFSFFVRGGSSFDVALLGGFAVAGVFTTMNLAYLLWRMPAPEASGQGTHGSDET